MKEPNSRRNLHELSSMKMDEWTAQELSEHHRMMSELSPWLNTQGTHIHAQIIQEIAARSHAT